MMTPIQVELYLNELKEGLKKDLSELKEMPRIAFVELGHDEALARSITRKKKFCEEFGIIVNWYNYPKSTDFETLELEVSDLEPHYDGIAVFPYSKINKTTISANKDIMGFNGGCVPIGSRAVLDYIKESKIRVAGRDVVVVGRRDYFGKDLANRLIDADATVTVCHSRSNLEPHLYHCDLVIATSGKPMSLDCHNIQVPVIDAGVSYDSDGYPCGDCYNKEDIVFIEELINCALVRNIIEVAANDD